MLNVFRVNNKGSENIYDEPISKIVNSHKSFIVFAKQFHHNVSDAFIFNFVHA